MKACTRHGSALSLSLPSLSDGLPVTLNLSTEGYNQCMCEPSTAKKNGLLGVPGFCITVNVSVYGADFLPHGDRPRLLNGSTITCSPWRTAAFLVWTDRGSADVSLSGCLLPKSIRHLLGVGDDELAFLLSFLDSFRTWACDEEAVRLLASVRLLCNKSFGKIRKEKVLGVFWLFAVCED